MKMKTLNQTAVTQLNAPKHALPKGPPKCRKGSCSRHEMIKKSSPRTFAKAPQARPKVEDEDPEDPPEPEVTVPVPVGFSPEFSPIKGET